MKRKVKRFAAGKEVEIEERSTKSDRLKAEELGKGPDDYATMGARARATSPFSGPKEYISESKEVETETEMPKGIAAGFSAKRYLEESEPKGGGSTSETKPAVEKKTAKKPVAKKSPSYEDTGAKIGSQGGFKFDQPKDTSRGLRLAPGSLAEKIAGKISGALDKSQKVGAEAMKESGRQARVDKIRRNVGSNLETYGMKKGGKVSSASSRADGCAQRGKTRGKMV
jgi:hypothetical protein